MSRTIPFACLAVVIVSIFAVAQSTASLTISIYAPEVKDAPLRITGFQIRNGSVGVSIYNQSDKTVTSFALGGLLSTPPGCTSDSTFAGKAYVSSRQMNLTIRSHETAIVSDAGEWGSPFDPTGLVPAAQRYKYAYLHVQAMVFAVHFSDGRAWSPARESMPKSGMAVLDPQLAILDSPACAHLDVDSILNSLEGISKVGFNDTHVDENVTERGGPESRVPHLVFRCSLQDDSAKCPLN